MAKGNAISITFVCDSWEAARGGKKQSESEVKWDVRQNVNRIQCSFFFWMTIYNKLCSFASFIWSWADGSEMWIVCLFMVTQFEIRPRFFSSLFSIRRQTAALSNKLLLTKYFCSSMHPQGNYCQLIETCQIESVHILDDVDDMLHSKDVSCSMEVLALNFYMNYICLFWL